MEKKLISLFEKKINKNQIRTIVDTFNLNRQFSVELFENINDIVNNDIFQSNIEVLKNYPYFFSDESVQELKLEIHIYYSAINEIYIIAKNGTLFMFENKECNNNFLFQWKEDNPLFVKNIVDYHIIKYLSDNILTSEQCGKDNHIYLYYDEWIAYYILLCTVNINTFLSQKKFVFLIGETNLKKYPINFKEQYGVDFSKNESGMLSVDECKRFCFFIKYAYCGVDFSTDVLSQSSNIIYIRSWEIDDKNTIEDKKLHLSDKYIKWIESDICINRSDFFEYLYKNKNNLYLSWDGGYSFPGNEELINKLEYLLIYKDKISFADIFKAYFIVKDYYVRGNVSRRMYPIFLFEPHIPNPEIYRKLLLKFDYSIQMGVFRDPIKRYASIARREDSPPWGIYPPCTYSMNINVPYYAFKFEDLKMYPKDTLISICKVLDIPFNEMMLCSQYSEVSTSNSEIIKSFDLKSVLRPVDDVVPLFDQIRLRFYFKEYCSYFGYENFYTNLPELGDDEIKNIFDIPFYVELVNRKSHENIYKEFTWRYWNQMKNIKAELMPQVLCPINRISYKGAISLNHENILFCDENKYIFILCDEQLMYMGKIFNYYNNNFRKKFIELEGRMLKIEEKIVEKERDC